MGISSAMFAGVSGLNTLGSSMAVIGDNIANVNTIGFKSSRTTFETLLAQNIASASGTSQVGRGVTMSAVDPVFSQGSFESTNEPTDMAIGGDGFFMVRSTETGMFYTRAGHFRFDEEGFLVNPADLRVQGWILEPNQSDPQGAITDIQINATSSAPQATEEIQISVNLDTDSLFAETPGTVESDPASTSGFMFQDGTNDSLVFNDGTNTYTVDLVSTSNNYFNENEVYTGSQVSSIIQQAINDAASATLTGGTYSVTYSEANNEYTFANSASNPSVTVQTTSTMEDLLGLSANLTLTAGNTTTTGQVSEIAYNIMDGVNSTFVVAVDGGDPVNVSLTAGTYTIPELRLEIETQINTSLSADGQSVTADVRYDYTDQVFQVMSSTRGGTTSRIEVDPVTGSTNNFLPTINITDYTEHLGETSNGLTNPGFTQSRMPNDSRFLILAGTNDVIIMDGGAATRSLVTHGSATSGGYYTGDQVAQFMETAFASYTGNATDWTVTYDEATDRFNVTNNLGAAHTVDWTDTLTTAESMLGYTADSELAASGGNDLSDNGVAFNIVAGINDSMEVIVDADPTDNSVPTVAVTIDAGAYTGTTLSRELEQAINEAILAAGGSETVEVTFTDNRMRIASTTLGELSMMQINRDLGITVDTGLVGGTLQIDDNTPNTGVGFSVTDPDNTSNYTTSLVVYDTLGNQHTVSFYFRKASQAADNTATTWEWFAYIPSSDTASGQAEAQARGTLTFNQQGQLTGQSATTWLTTTTDASGNTVDGEGFDFGSGAEAQQDIDIDFGLIAQTNVSTQFSAASSTIFQIQDGFGSGFLQDVSVDTDGVISGNYSNGQVLYLARVALANFVNPWGLDREGGNLWSETRNSGQPTTGTPGSAGLGLIAPNSLEQSNVDLSTEFVNMIIQQRGFQANSRVITTTDDMMAELINLKR